MNKLVRITLLAAAMTAGSVMAFADCPTSITIDSEGARYQCSYERTLPDGSCMYNNCKYIGKTPAAEEEMLAY
jgi:hypothetical protein